MKEKVAYFLTFRCYGTWLHGDAKFSVDKQHNQWGEEFVEPDAANERFSLNRMKQGAQLLTPEQRLCVENTIQEVANYRGWSLHALNVRTNHVHAVVGAEVPPEKVLNDFKSYSTRRLREANFTAQHTEIWASHGSTIYLWDCQSFETACDYVSNRQDEKRSEPEA